MGLKAIAPKTNPAGSGTVTSVSVASANGLGGTVSSPTTTPSITLNTTITGVLKGNGTAISAALNSDLPAMSSTVGGAVPTPPNNTTTWLRGDGTWTETYWKRTGTVLSQTTANDTINQTLASGSIGYGGLDSFSRPQIVMACTNGFLRLGSNQSDGDPTGDIPSQGAVVWNKVDGDFGARIKANRFGLTAASDSSLYYFIADDTQVFFKDASLSNIFKLDRSTKILSLGSPSSNAGQIALYNSTNANSVTVNTGATSANWTLTLPTTSGSNGQILSTNGSGVTSWVTPSGGTIWTVVSASQPISAGDYGYFTNGGARVVLTLPTTSVVGSRIQVSAHNSNGWRISQNAGQTIYAGVSQSTTGVSGYLESTSIGDTIELVCVVANTDWREVDMQGELTII